MSSFSGATSASTRHTAATFIGLRLSADGLIMRHRGDAGRVLFDRCLADVAPYHKTTLPGRTFTPSPPLCRGRLVSAESGRSYVLQTMTNNPAGDTDGEARKLDRDTYSGMAVIYCARVTPPLRGDW